MDTQTLTEELIEKAVIKFDKKAEIQDGKLYVRGEEFDPDSHLVGDDGLPELNSKGYLKRKRGRKNGSTYTRKTSDPEPETRKNAKPKIDKNRMAADETCVTLETVHIMMVGEHAKMTPGQKEAISESLTECYAKYGVISLPPELRLFGALAFYEFSVFRHPETQTKLERIKSEAVEKAAKERGLAGKLFAKFGKKKNERGENKDTTETPA